MAKEESEEPGTSALGRRARNTAVALVVGVVGSALWEMLLRPPTIWLGNALLEVVAAVWSGYLDTLYASVGQAQADSLVTLPFMLSVLLIGGGPVAAAVSLHRRFLGLKERLKKVRERALLAAQGGAKIAPLVEPEKDLDQMIQETDADMRELERSIVRGLYPSVGAFVIAVAIVATHTFYVRSVVNWTGRSIEIVAPYVSQADLLKLRSEFRSVETAAQFFQLDARLRQIAVASGRTLPEFQPVGKR